MTREDTTETVDWILIRFEFKLRIILGLFIKKYHVKLKGAGTKRKTNV